ncbi:hypothetical protein [Aureispira anguillae]|uniref:Uncharacterized protein n=1 Tax=Aureispira anguillae TaxID=2864201 RepID=A0A915YBR9_9BACT|nr:hypothetical protein [Aureispira anguillae]BDS10108.1 hypothetical protein AsAng_0008150 [Aureispira anguillae]
MNLELNFLGKNHNYIKIELKNLAIINNSEDLNRLREAFYYVSNIAKTFYSSELGSEYAHTDSKILKIEYNSPAEIIAWVNPSWIAVFLFIIAQYDNLFRNSRRFIRHLFRKRDILESMVNFRGVTTDELLALKSHISFLLAYKIDEIQIILLKFGITLEYLKRSLIGFDGRIEIEIKDRMRN